MKHSTRYSRQEILRNIGEGGQDKIQSTTVAVVGVGGLGVPVSQYLTGAGIGKLVLIDGDKVDLSNLHRQVLFSESDTGRPKVEVAAEKLSALNSEVSFELYQEYLSTDNAEELLATADIIVDCTDTFATKYLLNDIADMLDKPWVMGAIHQYTGQVGLFNVNGSSNYRCVFPEPPEVGEMPSCAEAGVLGSLTAVVGGIQATEVIKHICGVEGLRNKLLTFNVIEYSQSVIEVPRSSRKAVSLLDDYKAFCEPKGVQDISVGEAYARKEDFLWVDVRESFELEIASLPWAVHFPLGQFHAGAVQLPSDKPIIFMCHHGMRSLQAASISGLSSVYNLSGGIDAWSREIDPKVKRY